jgi:plastocyanin
MQVSTFEANRCTLGVAVALVIVIAHAITPWRDGGPSLASAASTVVVLAGQTNGGGPAERQFNAASITISAGDTVRWQWYADEHDVTAYDGSYTSPLLTGAGQSFERTFSTPGTYTYYCDRHASTGDADPARIDERIADGKMVGKIVVQAASDTTGPATTNVVASPNPTSGAPTVFLTASVSDAGLGGSAISAAEYFIDTAGVNGSGTPMSASDGSFNSASENITATINTATLSLGARTLYVHGRDAAGNWGSTATAALNVTIGSGLSLTTQAVNFGSVLLNAADQVITTSPQAWRAADARGTGAGWNVTLTAADFTSPGGTIPVANFKVQLLASKVTTVSGNAPPVTRVTSFQPLSNTSPLKLLSAGAGEGMGSYDFTPDFELMVPASTAAAVYEAALVVSINSGP